MKNTPQASKAESQTAALGLLGLLWLSLFVSAIAVVYTTYRIRHFTQAGAHLAQLQHAFQVENGQLLLEKSALATYARIEKLATHDLNMRVPTGHEIVVVEVPQ
jgi:cell division protein FtsL